MYNLSTFTETQITTSGSVVTSVLYRNSPTIYGDKIVWVDNRKGMNQPDIYMYNLSTFTKTQITTSGSTINDLAIYGDRVVWTERIGNWSDYKSNIYMYNTSTRNKTQITSGSDINGLAIYGDIVVWTERLENGMIINHIFTCTTYPQEIKLRLQPVDQQTLLRSMKIE